MVGAEHEEGTDDLSKMQWLDDCGVETRFFTRRYRDALHQLRLGPRSFDSAQSIDQDSRQAGLVAGCM